MIRTFLTQRPRIHATAFVHDSAVYFHLARKHKGSRVVF